MQEASAPHPLLQALLRRAAEAAAPAEPLLAALRAEALALRGELLRLSPRRAVFRVALGGRDWVLKLDAPERPLEPVRRLLRAGPARREARLHDRLAPRLRWEGPALADEQPGGLSWFARPWQPGRSLAEALPAEAAAAGEGLALLHEWGFSDPDLAPGDLLLRADGSLLPLDLGHARMRPRGASSRSDRARDLARLLAGLPEERARASAEGLLDGYGRLAPPPCRAPQLRAQARALRGELLRRHSRRCLRECSDFALEAGLPRRRADPAGAGWIAVEWRFPALAEAAECFRGFYELELHGLRAARVSALADDGRGVAVRVRHPAGPAPAADGGDALLDLGEAFARAGFALDLDCAEAFRRDEQGTAWLVHPAGWLGPRG